MTLRGERIRRARQLQRMSQQDLAQATRVGMRTIGRIESGKGEGSPSLAVVEAYLGLNGAAPAPDNDASNPRIKQATVLELLAELAARFANLEARTAPTPTSQEK